MIEWLLANKEGAIAVGTALLIFIGAVIKLTPTESDDSVFNRILGVFGLSRFGVRQRSPEKDEDA